MKAPRPGGPERPRRFRWVERRSAAGLVLALASLSGSRARSGTGPDAATTAAALPAAAALGPAPAGTADVLRVRGEQIVDGRGRPVILRGVALGNDVWGNVRLPRLHHSEVDFQRIAAMGMNAVRFYMNYRTFESDAAPGSYLADGWQWLDDNVAWAKRHGIVLVLNMHVPPGGFQSMGAGKALWDKPELQERLVALWTAIARRYRGESTIAGYDLLNEPVVTRSKQQWIDLAARLAIAIRAVDPEHILFVERLNAIGHDWAEDANRNFFTLPDPNVVYEFHFYEPFHFTHQGAPWVPFTPTAVRYPDPSRAEVPWFLLDRRGGTDDSPKLPPGNSPWTYYPGAPFRVNDPSIVLGKPMLIVDRNSGLAHFDDLTLEELDDAGKVKRVIWTQNLSTNRGWFFWTKDGTGGSVPGKSGHGDEASIAAGGARGEANLGSDVLRFRTRPGATYRLNGWMRGENIPPSATCQIRIDFFSSAVPVQASDKAFLAQELDAYVGWGRRHRVPLFLGELGAIRTSFDDDRGGLRWVADMLDLIAKRHLSFSYHAYHEESFGLYRGAGLPSTDRANVPLIELLTKRLATSTRH